MAVASGLAGGASTGGVSAAGGAWPAGADSALTGGGGAGDGAKVSSSTRRVHLGVALINSTIRRTFADTGVAVISR
jgi:hypothetical protein